jgi:hypothetical protein
LSDEDETVRSDGSLGNRGVIGLADKAMKQEEAIKPWASF